MESTMSRFSCHTVESMAAPASTHLAHLSFSKDSKISSKTPAEGAHGLVQTEQDIFVVEDPKSNFSSEETRSSSSDQKATPSEKKSDSAILGKRTHSDIDEAEKVTLEHVHLLLGLRSTSRPKLEYKTPLQRRCKKAPPPAPPANQNLRKPKVPKNFQIERSLPEKPAVVAPPLPKADAPLPRLPEIFGRLAT